MQFHRKGMGRVFTFKAEHLEEVLNTIKEVDEFEFEYLRDNFVTTWQGKRELIYSGKFEIDMEDLTEACWNKGIPIWCVSQEQE